MVRQAATTSDSASRSGTATMSEQNDHAVRELPTLDAPLSRTGEAGSTSDGRDTANAAGLGIGQSRMQPEISVLVVSSNESFRESILGQLLAAGYRARGVAQLADPAVADAEPDVFVLDTAGNYDPGVDWCYELRQRVRTKRQPYLIVVNVPEAHECIPAFLEAGADDVLAAPFQAEQLRRRLLVA